MSRQLCVGAAAAVLFAYPATAVAQIVEIRHIPPKAGTETDIGTTRIVVTGSTENRYDKVVTTSLDAWVSVKAPETPARSGGKSAGTVFVEGRETVRLPDGFSTAPTIYKLSFPYNDPRSTQVANQRISPVDLCNDKLQSLSGAAREAFRNEGGNILRADAYFAEAGQGWFIKPKGGGLFPDAPQLQTWKDSVGIPAVVACRKLTGPKPRDTTETRGPPRRPGKPLPDPDPTPPRVTPPPTIAKVTLRGEPSGWQNVAGQTCPTQVRLYGFVEVRRAFSGKAIFFGPAFLNPPVALSFPGEGRRTLTETYNVKWPTGATGMAAPGGVRPRPRTQQVTLKFNVADADGKVLDSAQVTETLTCRVGPQIRARGQ